ncbi:hypothetical protein Btru_054768 [Bulinus truncatus]|nr:hypothetical protein Btru_054768 [Bulinus truncatus]
MKSLVSQICRRRAELLGGDEPSYYQIGKTSRATKAEPQVLGDGRTAGGAHVGRWYCGGTLGGDALSYYTVGEDEPSHCTGDKGWERYTRLIMVANRSPVVYVCLHHEDTPQPYDHKSKVTPSRSSTVQRNLRLEIGSDE